MTGFHGCLKLIIYNVTRLLLKNPKNVNPFLFHSHQIANFFIDSDLIPVHSFLNKETSVYDALGKKSGVTLYRYNNANEGEEGHTSEKDINK